jgi:two-component system, cell cycle sensor histidine kinase and response regulator CckA
LSSMGGSGHTHAHPCGQPCEVECPYTNDFCQSQKLESLGLLVGEVAHDLNNLLAIVLGHAEMALDEGRRGISPEKRLGDIREATQNAAALCKSLLAHAGRSTPVSTLIDLNTFVPQLQHLLRIIVPRESRLECHVESGLPLWQGDPSQLRQILMNLVINAAEALGDQPGTIRMDLSGLAHGSSAPQVCIRVHDTGCGIEPTTLRNLFTPFFSTKAGGRGLGLTAVQTLVQELGGTIKAESVVGQGTTFTILLPLVTDPHATLPPVAAPQEVPAIWEGQATILFADDEPDLRMLGVNMLERPGVRVLTATDGREAVQLYEQCRDEIDLVFLDVIMPKMNGCEAMKHIRRINPEARVVVISGHSDRELDQRWNGTRPDEVLMKPFTAEQLRTTTFRYLRQRTQVAT